MVNKVTPDHILSASRLPAVMGISRYQTPNDELEYSIRAMRGEERPDIGNEAMAWGNLMEPLILQDAARRLELVDLEIDHPTARFHESLPLCCSLDGTGDGRGQVITSDPEKGIFVIGQDSIQLDGVGVLEAKLTGMDVEDSPPLWRGPIQLQAQMDIIQAKWGAVCTLYRGTQLRVFLFSPHRATLDVIASVSRDFQRRLNDWKTTGQVDYYPPADGEKWPELRGPYPVEDDLAVDLPQDAVAMATEILSLKKVIKSAEEKIDSHEKKIKDLMGTATKATAGDYVITWPTRSYKAQPEKMVAAKAAYTIRQSTLTIKEAKA